MLIALGILSILVVVLLVLLHYLDKTEAQFSPPKSWPPMITHIRPAWIPIRSIGDGEFAQVFLVEDSQHSRPMAIKVLKDRYREDQEMALRFCDEVTILSAASRSGAVPRLLDWSGPNGNPLWYAMEALVSAMELRKAIDYVNADPKGRDIRFRIVRLIADRVARLHECGIVHRDLCPRNILVTCSGDPDVRIIDFGTAKFHQYDQTRYRLLHDVTQPGWFMGKANYAAPEALDHGFSCADYKSDVFSLGVLIHQTITGKLPFTWVIPGKKRLIRPDASALTRNGLSLEGRNAIIRCLDDDPGKRPEVQEISRAL